MIFDESVTQAFEVIRAAFRFDAFTPVPHPDNIRFRADEERKVMRRLGLMLADLASDLDIQWAGRIVQRFFWQEIGLEQLPEEHVGVPRFLLPPEHQLEPRIDVAELAQQMKRVALPEQEMICIVSSKLNLLQKLLSLSDVQIKFLKLIYVRHLHSDLHGHERFSLQAALQHIEVLDQTHCTHVIAALIDEPVTAVEAMFTPPMTLVALRFLDSGFNDRQRNLQNALTAPDAFITLLETPFRSHEALLNAILEPEYDADLLDDGDTPIGRLYELYPPEIAACYERAVLGRPLTALHIQHIVQWFTGRSLSPRNCAPLAGRLTFEVIREAIKRAALDCCTGKQTYTEFALMKSLYAAAK